LKFTLFLQLFFWATFITLLWLSVLIILVYIQGGPVSMAETSESDRESKNNLSLHYKL